MILGVDHIALSCENVVHGAKLLGEVGYRAKFIQEGLSNHPAKQSLLTVYDPLHSVAYCQAEQGVSLELTQHSSLLRDAVSPYQVLLNGPPADVIPFVGDLSSSWESVWRVAVGCSQPVAALWRSLHAQFWYDAQHDEPLPVFVRALLVPITDLSVSEKFWVKGLGCRVVNRGVVEERRRWARVAFRALVPTWSLDVVLVECDRGGKLAYLDDAGFPCLAVITNRMTEDQDTAMEMGGRDAGEEFALEVGGRVLGISVLHGPDNELIELIEFRHS